MALKLRVSSNENSHRSNQYIRNVWELPSAETITCVVPNVFTLFWNARMICFVKRNRMSHKYTHRIVCRSISHDKTNTSSARAMHKMIGKTFGSTHVMVLAHPQNTQHEKHCKSSQEKTCAVRNVFNNLRAR